MDGERCWECLYFRRAQLASRASPGQETCSNVSVSKVTPDCAGCTPANGTMSPRVGAHISRGMPRQRCGDQPSKVRESCVARSFYKVQMRSECYDSHANATSGSHCGRGPMIQLFTLTPAHERNRGVQASVESGLQSHTTRRDIIRCRSLHGMTLSLAKKKTGAGFPAPV